MKSPRLIITCVSMGVGALLLLFILRPSPIIVARSCTILVQDDAGKPLTGVKVSRDWAFGSPDTLEDRVTGPDGRLNFDARVQSHSRLGRFMANVANISIVHGSSHITDAYLVSFPENYTAEITSDATFNWVYDEGHFAQIELSGLPRNQHHQARFTIRPKKP